MPVVENLLPVHGCEKRIPKLPSLTFGVRQHVSSDKFAPQDWTSPLHKEQWILRMVTETDIGHKSQVSTVRIQPIIDHPRLILELG